jgi:hypothetical protein
VKPDPAALAVAKRLTMFEAIASTFNRRRACEQAYYQFHRARGVRLRGKYRM